MKKRNIFFVILFFIIAGFVCVYAGNDGNLESKIENWVRNNCDPDPDFKCKYEILNADREIIGVGMARGSYRGGGGGD